MFIISSTPSNLGHCSKHYASDEEVKIAVMKWLKEKSTDFYESRVLTLIRRWNMAVERNGDCVEKLGCDPRRISFISMYDTCPCAGNYSYTKEKLITF